MNWLANSNWFIAICAFISCLASFYLFNQWLPASYFAYCVAVFFGTKVVYSFLRLGNSVLQQAVFTQFFKENIAFVVAGFISLWFSNLLSHHWLVLLVAIVTCFFYGMHIFGSQFQRFSFRTSAWTKLISIAFVWVLVTVVIPFLLMSNVNQFTAEKWCFIAAQFVFIFALALPFDMVDHVRQDMLGFQTIPKALGVETAKQLGRFLIFTAWILFGFVALPWFFAITICLILYLKFLNSDLQSKSITEFTLQFDGLIILLSVAAILLSFIV